jgi:hypothetical protein
MTQSLVSKLLAEANNIHKSSTKGFGNFVVVSPHFSSSFGEIIRKELRKEKIKLIFQ